MSQLNRRLHAAVVALALLLCAAPVAAQQREPIRYTLSFPAVRTHYVEVQASIPTDGEHQIDLMMPVWTPGSYLVREYSRNVESLTALDAAGKTLSIEKTRKNRWRVTGAAGSFVTLRYRVYAHEMSVRTDWIDDEFGLLNGAATYITRLEHRDRPYEVKLNLPKEWARSLSGMDSSEPNVFRARDYDTFVDSPIVAGSPAIYEFSAGGRPHYLVDVAERGQFDGARAASDLARVVEETVKLWGDVPYERYFFFNVPAATENGLEHKNSTVMNARRESTATRAGYLDWLSVAAHEHFHAWNVKRLRPVELGPFDYENEVYSRSLWFAEGVTDYYADLLIRRAGISTRDEYLASLSKVIAGLQTTPGRLVQPLEEASFDAWIKYYRPDENSINSSISYYTKGTVVGFLLDANIRRLTSGRKSLDDLMRQMFKRYSGEKGYTPDDLRMAAADVVGESGTPELRSWLDGALSTTSELDYGPAMEWFGLAFRPPPAQPRAQLGVATRQEGSRTLVTEVRRNSAAFNAGIDVGDELVAVNDVPVAGQLAARLTGLAPGAKVVFTIARRGETLKLDVTLGIDATQNWQLGLAAASSASQQTHLTDWLNQ